MYVSLELNSSDNNNKIHLRKKERILNYREQYVEGSWNYILAVHRDSAISQ